MSCFLLRKKYPDSFTHLLFLCPAARVFMIQLYFYGSFTSDDTLHHLIHHGHITDADAIGRKMAELLSDWQNIDTGEVPEDAPKEPRTKRQHKKIFAKDEGEYVDFEEI